MTETQDAFRVRITGGVQGVGYRAWTRGQALQLGLTGWVRSDRMGWGTTAVAAVATLLVTWSLVGVG